MKKSPRGRPDLQKNSGVVQEKLQCLGPSITAAADYHRVDGRLIAAILADEISRRDLWDDVQDRIARRLIRDEGWSEKIMVRLIQTVTRQPLDQQSFGLSQMNVGVLEDLIENGLIQMPERWDEDRIDVLLGVLLDEDRAPWLVAARVRQTIDYWMQGGVDLTNRPEILGTLYSMGLTGPRGLHPDPQANERGHQIALFAQTYLRAG